MARMPHLPCMLLLLVMSVGTVSCSKPPLGAVATDGKVEVRYITGRIGKVLFASGKSQQRSEKDLLQIQIWIENLSDSKKLEYKGWGDDNLSSAKKARLKDDLGNTYKQVTFGLMHRPVGQKAKESLYPGSAIQDILVFELPVEKAQMVHLILPKGNYTDTIEDPPTLDLVIPVASFNGGGL
ncbi:MAG: hypothetical protein JWN70_6503 [Planctomycetaceae bacterium]|nr:hypothetical protein [Planctomycetaceae bacterium]